MMDAQGKPKYLLSREDVRSYWFHTLYNQTQYWQYLCSSSWIYFSVSFILPLTPSSVFYGILPLCWVVKTSCNFSLLISTLFLSRTLWSLWSVYWTPSWVDCVSPLQLVVFLGEGLYLAPLSGMYSFAVPFCVDFYLNFCVYGRLVVFLDLGEVASIGNILLSHQYTSLSSPKGRGHGPRVGSDLFANSVPQAARWQFSCVCPLVGEAGLEACSGLLVGGAMSCPPAGKQRQNTLWHTSRQYWTSLVAL